MQAGDLKDYVIVEQFTLEELDGGASTEKWVPAADLYCKIEPIRAREYKLGANTKGVANKQVKARYPLPEGVDVARRTRLLHGDTILQVVSIEEYNHMRPPFVKLMCVESTDGDLHN